MRKARIIFTPIEIEYNKLYGRYPDYDFYVLMERYGVEQAGLIRQQRIDKVWQIMQERHKKEQEKLLQECPFV